MRVNPVTDKHKLFQHPALVNQLQVLTHSKKGQRNDNNQIRRIRSKTLYLLNKIARGAVRSHHLHHVAVPVHYSLPPVVEISGGMGWRRLGHSNMSLRRQPHEKYVCRDFLHGRLNGIDQCEIKTDPDFSFDPSINSCCIEE